MATDLTSGSLVRDMYRRHWPTLLLGYLLRTVHQVCEALVPVAAGWVIGQAVATGELSQIVIGVVAILVLFAVLGSSAAVGYYLTGRVALTEAHRLRIAAVERILDPARRRSTRQSGELLSITSSDTRGATQVVETIGGLIASLMGLGVAVTVLLRIDLRLGLGLLAAVVVLVVVTQSLGPHLVSRLSARQEAVGVAAAVATDLLTGLRALRGFGGVPEAVRRYRTASRASLAATGQAATSTAIVLGVSSITTGILVVIAAAIAARYAFAGQISVAELVTVIGMATFLVDPLTHITAAIRDLAITRASGARVVELLDEPAARVESIAVDGAPESVSSDDVVLALDAVTDGFVAPLTLDLSRGEMIGVVTADVSTADRLADLMSGTTPASSGRVLLHGRTIDTVNPHERTTTLLAEPHVVHLLGDTLAEAMTTSDSSSPAGSQQVESSRALEAASVRVADLAGHGGETKSLDQIALLDHGANLSGGQRQRVALARALHADRDVLVLRDPTSAVDAVTEHEIVGGVRGLRGDDRLTVVFTTSPLWLAQCHRVLFVDDGGRHHIDHHDALVSHAGYREVVLR